MGFFDRLARSIFGKKDPEVARPSERDSYFSLTPFTQPSAAAVVPVAVNGRQRPAEQTVSGCLLSVAAAELPLMPTSVPLSLGPSSETREAFGDEVSAADFFADDFDQDLDDAFASLVSHDAAPQPESNGAEMVAADQLVVEHLFADIAANYARPVKNFVFELKRGTATKEWIDICRPAMHGITRAAEGMGLSVAAKLMVDFEAALSLAQSSKQRVLGGKIRDLLLWCYEDLTKAMPIAFLLGQEEQEREGIIINSLLMQIPGVGRVTVEKLYRAGLTSLEALFIAKPDQVAVATGIPVLLSERICKKFQSYRGELEGQSRDVGDSGQRAHLAEMLADLRQKHESFQRASENEGPGPTLATEKRERRRQRHSCLLQINVVLAEMGELELINELHKLSFERRIRRLENFLGSPPATMATRISEPHVTT